MAFDDIEPELGLLLTRMISEPQDRHELYFPIRQKLSELKADGAPLPDNWFNLSRIWRLNLPRRMRMLSGASVSTAP